MVPSARKRGNAQTDTQEVPSKHRKHFVRLTEHRHRWPRGWISSKVFNKSNRYVGAEEGKRKVSIRRKVVNSKHR